MVLFVFFFCLSSTLFGTGKGYKYEIWQEDVVSYYKEESYENKIFTKIKFNANKFELIVKIE